MRSLELLVANCGRLPYYSQDSTRVTHKKLANREEVAILPKKCSCLQLMIEQVLKFFKFYLKADGVYQAHSPLLYKLMTEVVEPRGPLPFEETIESVRSRLLLDESPIAFQEYGAGSTKQKKAKTVKTIAASSLSPRRQCRQLARLVQYKSPKTVLEMGTSLGVSTLYLGAANLATEVYTLEGDPQVAAIAQANFTMLHLHNIQLAIGRFEDTLVPTLKKMQSVDLAFIDGNHRYTPTVQYFEQILPYCTEDSILVFDDIHWSEEMEKAWQYVQQHTAVTLTVDLFHMGIVFFSDSVSTKAHRQFIEYRYKPWKIGLFG